MEDAATAEISRAQVWQWVKHGSKLDDGRTVTSEMVRNMTAELIASLKAKHGSGKWDEAGKIFEHMMTGKDFTEFLTLAAYNSID
jgi:malate synthase